MHLEMQKTIHRRKRKSYRFSDHRIHRTAADKVAHQDQMMETVLQDQMTEAVHQEQTTEAVHQDKMMEAVHKDQMMEAVHQDQTTETVHKDQTMEAVHQDQMITEVIQDQTTEAVHQDQTMEAVHKDQMTEDQDRDHKVADSRDAVTMTDQEAMTSVRDVHQTEEETTDTRIVMTEEITEILVTSTKMKEMEETEETEEMEEEMTEESQAHLFLHQLSLNRNLAVQKLKIHIRKKNTELMKMMTECQKERKAKTILSSLRW